MVGTNPIVRPSSRSVSICRITSEMDFITIMVACSLHTGKLSASSCSKLDLSEWTCHPELVEGSHIEDATLRQAQRDIYYGLF
jgi:hypothetical protein